MVHIHAHFQLVVGDDLTKATGCRLRRSSWALARPDGEFFVRAELELILLVVRLTLKHLTGTQW